jgi:phage terminase small subunit
MNLTPQQEKFAQSVVSGMSQAEAYRQAYPKSQKWKEAAVWSQSSRLMANSIVSSRVDALLKKSAEKAGIDATETMREIRLLAQSDIAGIMHDDGTVRLPHELDARTRAAVASFEIDPTGRIKYKFWDKNSALDKAARISGLYEKDNNQRTDSLSELLARLSGNVIGVVGLAKG